MDIRETMDKLWTTVGTLMFVVVGYTSPSINKRNHGRRLVFPVFTDDKH
jgi:hypothetical protein